MKEQIKFGHSEKHTKFEKNLPHGFDKSADLPSKRQNHEEDFFQIICASQKVLTLMRTHDRFSFDLVHYYCKRKEHHLSQYLSMRKIHNVIRINDD